MSNACWRALNETADPTVFVGVSSELFEWFKGEEEEGEGEGEDEIGETEEARSSIGPERGEDFG